MTERGEVFTSFGEAARLYADYAAVVEQVRQAFDVDVNRYLDALRERVESMVPHTVQENRDDKKLVRRWWLSDDDNSIHSQHPYVWIRSSATKIVSPGVLDVSGWAYDLFKPFRHRLVAVKDALKLPPSCRVSKGLEGSLFTVTINYGEEDPVGAAAQPVADILTALFEVEQTLPVTKT